MTKKSFKTALIALVMMMPIMALRAENVPVVKTDKTEYAVEEKISVTVTEISKDATIKVWYSVVDSKNDVIKDSNVIKDSKNDVIKDSKNDAFKDNKSDVVKSEERKEMKKISDTEHYLLVSEDMAGKCIKIVAENTKDKTFSKEVNVQIKESKPTSKSTSPMPKP